MTLDEIKAATLAGKLVHWSNDGYRVTHNKDQWLIVCDWNGHAIGLTWTDGTTLNGRPEEFYTK